VLSRRRPVLSPLIRTSLVTNYILRRLLQAALILWLVSMAVFILLRIAPGDPALLQQGVNATPERIAQVHKDLGLDDSYPLQYWHWIESTARFDLGKSVLTQTSVTSEFKSRFPVSLELMLLTLILTVILGIPFGVVSAVKRNGPVDYGVRFFAVVGLAVPAFWVATLVILVPAAKWGYAPPFNQQISFFSHPWENIKQFGPPSAVLALGSTAGIMRLVRSELLEVLRADYIRTARAKGLSGQRVVLRHALKNSLIPVVTVLGLIMSGLLGGSIIIETIFNLRGLGAYIFTATLQKDFAVVQTLVIYTAAAAILLNLAVDILYAVLDPRIRYS
jgi:peptide/nickel transport system permease protein